MEKIKLSVNGMSCSHCERAVKNAVEELAGVESVIVDLAEKSVVIEYDSQQSNFDAFKAVIEEEGYEVVGQL